MLVFRGVAHFTLPGKLTAGTCWKITPLNEGGKFIFQIYHSWGSMFEHGHLNGFPLGGVTTSKKWNSFTLKKLVGPVRPLCNPENKHDNGKNRPFEDVYISPIKHGDFPASHVSFLGEEVWGTSDIPRLVGQSEASWSMAAAMPGAHCCLACRVFKKSKIPLCPDGYGESWCLMWSKSCGPIGSMYIKNQLNLGKYTTKITSNWMVVFSMVWFPSRRSRINHGQRKPCKVCPCQL